MDERRKLPRHRTLKGGRILFDRAGSIDCQVRNLSPIGACIEVVSPLGIPDDFMLSLTSDNMKQNCHVIWRTATRLGVAFCG